MTVTIRGRKVTTKELREDAEVAIRNGYENKFAFTPETVFALLDKLDEFERIIKGKVE